MDDLAKWMGDREKVRREYLNMKMMIRLLNTTADRTPISQLASLTRCVACLIFGGPW